MENNRAYLLRKEITKSHLNNRICQHCSVKTSTVTPSSYYVFNISLSCNISIPSFIGNLWCDLLLGNHLNIRTGRITRIEIKNAIKKLKSGKAAACDNVPPEAIKVGGDMSEEVLLDFCNRVWSEEKTPEEWKKGLLIKLPKKGDLSYCKNWRGIMSLNMASKVFCRVILERIKIALDAKLREEQAGFRAGRSCTDQIATMPIIVEQSIEWQSSLYINFIDFE